MVDKNTCICLKNKNSINPPIQCPKKRINGTEFCGVHLRAKKKMLFADYLDNNPNISLTTVKINKISTEIKLYTNEDFLNNPRMSKFSIEGLKNTLEYQNITFSKRTTKSQLFKLLNSYFYTINNSSEFLIEIIKIQRWIRSLNLLKRIWCNNEDDFYTGENKFEVSLSSIYIIRDISAIYYWFDIDTFGNLCKTSDAEVKNPYSRNIIDDYYISKFKRMYKYESFVIKEEGMSDEQKFRNRMLTIFQKINKLDNYTDYNWFSQLDIINLKKMYAICEDIWNYRAQLSLDTKKKIVYNGMAFVIHPNIIQNYVNKRYIQDILLDNFDRLISQGQTIDDKKLGAMLILTALVEVSPDAAFAMPEYIQVD